MEKHFKQLIIARRDLNMSPGKLSSAFLIEKAKELGMIEGVDYFPIVDSRVTAGDFDVCRIQTYGGREDWKKIY